MASANLGGLGAKDGSAMEYNWILPSVAPLFLPWLAILGLLALKSNRRAAAWLIWMPLGVVMLFVVFPTTLPGGLTFMLDAICALVFGVSAVWLLSNHLRRSHRLLTFLCVVSAMAGFSALNLLAKQGATWEIELLQTGLVAGLGTLASSLALSVSGWICRRRFRSIGIYVWLLVSLILAWLLITLPFFVIAEISSRNQIAWTEFLLPVLCAAAANFALLLPFLLLSSVNSFFGDRFKALLNVTPEAPPVISPSPKPI